MHFQVDRDMTNTTCWQSYRARDTPVWTVGFMTFLKSLSPCYFWWSFYAKMKKRSVLDVNSLKMLPTQPQNIYKCRCY